MAIGQTGGIGLSDGNRESLQPSPIPLKGRYVDLYKRLKVTTPPAIFPVSLDQLKQQLRIDLEFTEDDDYLNGLIDVSTSVVEDYLRRKLITQSVTMGLDQWPFSSVAIWEGSVQLPRSALTGQSQVKLWYPPLQEVTSITITKRDGTTVVYDSDNYLVDTGTLDDYGRVILKNNSSIVSDVQEALSTDILYVCGYGDAQEDIPYAIRLGILMYAAYLYEHRGDCDAAGAGYERGKTPLDLSGAAGHLNFYRIERLQN